MALHAVVRKVKVPVGKRYITLLGEGGGNNQALFHAIFPFFSARHVCSWQR